MESTSGGMLLVVSLVPVLAPGALGALANNAAFVVAPRARTAGHNLGGRVFLHDYDESTDPEGRVLTLILCAPGGRRRIRSFSLKLESWNSKLWTLPSGCCW